MADQPMTSLPGSYGSSGANMLLRALAAEFVQASMDWGGPLRYFTTPSPTVGMFGDKVGVPVAPNSNSYIRTDGSAIVLNDDTGTTVDVTLNRPREFFFETTAQAKALLNGASDLALRMKINSALAAMYNGVVEDILATVVAGSTFNTAQGTYNSAATEANLVTAIHLILTQKPPEGQPLIGFLREGATSYGALAQIANFAQASTMQQGTGPTAYGAAFDQMYGQGREWHLCRWFMSQSLPRTGTSTSNIIFAPQSVAVAMRLPDAPSPGLGVNVENIDLSEKGIVLQLIQQWDVARQAECIGLKVIYGTAVVKPEWLIEFKT